jgi:hypothetical protein
LIEWDGNKRWIVLDMEMCSLERLEPSRRWVDCKSMMLYSRPLKRMRFIQQLDNSITANCLIKNRLQVRIDTNNTDGCSINWRSLFGIVEQSWALTSQASIVIQHRPVVIVVHGPNRNMTSNMMIFSGLHGSGTALANQHTCHLESFGVLAKHRKAIKCGTPTKFCAWWRHLLRFLEPVSMA